MDKTINKRLLLFFTTGMSLKKWHSCGFLSREQTYYKALGQNLDQIGFFTYGTVDDRDYLKESADDFLVLPKKINLSAILYSFIAPIVYRKQFRTFDIYKTNQMEGSWAAVLAKWLFRKKLVVRCGYEWLRFAEQQKKSFFQRSVKFFIEWISYKSADAIIITSESDKEYIADRFKISTKKINVVPNFIDTDTFKPLGLERKKRTMVSVGRLSEQKNYLALLEAIDGIDIELTIYGEGELREILEQKASTLINAVVKFSGRIDNSLLPQIFNEADIIILPSHYEGNPKVLLEAMSCGAAVIGTKVSGIQEIIEHKKNGYLAESTSVSALRAAIKAMIFYEYEKKIMREGARKTIEDGFSLQAVLEKELDVYARLEE